MKRIITYLLQVFGKRISPINAPAKSFEYGVGFLKRQLSLSSSLTIIDVGFADGTPGLLAHFSPDTYQYVCIDANPRFFPDLDAFHVRHATSVIEKCFCGEKEAKIPFNINPSGRSSRYSKGRATHVIEVPMKTLDGIIKNHAVKGPFLLKIDVEGAEVDVLQGALETLAECEAVIAEAWINPTVYDPDHGFARLTQFMDVHGFMLYDIFGGSLHKSGVLKQVDAVFIKTTNPSRLS